MHFDMRHEAWTDGRRIAVVWDTGHLCVYEHTPGFDTPKLVSWLAPEGGEWPWGRPPAAILARWGEVLGWPVGAVDAAGDWILRPDGDQLRLSGPRPITRPAPKGVRVGGGRRVPLPDDPAVVTRAAHLVASPEGTVLVDAELGLVWSLDAGALHQLYGVHEEWALQGVRAAGGVVVQASYQHRQGLLLRLEDDGRVDEAATTYGFTCPVALCGDRIHAVLPAEGTWRMQGGDQVTTTVGGHMFTALDPVRLELAYDELSEIPLDYGPWSASCAGGLWVACDGQTLVILERLGGRWVERYDRIRPPTGDPTQLAGRPRLAPVPPMRWAGDPGPFETRTLLRNIGQTQVGLHLVVKAPDTLRLTSMTLGEEDATVQDGLARFTSTALRHEAPLPLVMRGRATGPGTVLLHAVWPKLPEPLGDLELEVVVRSGLQAVREDARLDLDPEWTALLGAKGVLDPDAPEPDLERWLPRALSRCRVQTVAEAPDAVQTEWLRMSERDRAATSDGRVPAYKLASGQHWRITAAEADQIHEALGGEHALGAFAAQGPFEICGPTPLSAVLG